MLVGTEAEDASSWDAVVGRFADRSLLQTWEWAEAKVRTGPWSVERILYRDGPEVVGAAQVLTRSLPFRLGGIAWVNRGPVWDLGRGDGQVPSMLHDLYERFVLGRNLYLRVAPTVASDRLSAVMPPGRAFGQAGVSGHGAGRLDLTAPEERLRAGLKQSWRRFLAKAERSGTRVVTGRDDAIFNRFLTAHGEVLDQATYRKSTTPSLLGEVQRQLPADRRMLVLEAVAKGQPVSWVLIATYGATGEYLAAVSLPAARALNCGQLLMWNAILQLQREGFREFDVGGFDPEDTVSGISHFKGGINPVPYRYCGEIDAQANRWLRPVIRRAIGIGRIPLKLPGPFGPLGRSGRAGPTDPALRPAAARPVTSSRSPSGRPAAGMRSRATR